MFHRKEKTLKPLVTANDLDNSYVIGRIIKDYVLPNKLIFTAIISLVILSSLATGFKTYLMKPAIDEIFINKDMGKLIIVPILLVLTSVVLGLSTYFNQLLSNIIQLKIILDLKTRLFGNILHKDTAFFQNKSSSKINDYFNDIIGVYDMIRLVLIDSLQNGVTVAVLTVFIFIQNFKLALFALIVFPIAIWPLRIIGRIIKELSFKSRECSATTASATAEAFDNIRVIKSNNTEDYTIKQCVVLFKNTKNIALKISRRALMGSPLMEIIGSISISIVILYGGYNTINGSSTTGEFFSFMMALLAMYKPAKSFNGINAKFQSSMVAAKRIFTLLEQKNKIVEIENPKVIDTIKGNITFSKVVFNYPKSSGFENTIAFDEFDIVSDTKALNGLSLNITAGKSYALVGHSGSGKSTIFNLLLRFYDPTAGEIKIDGVNIKDLSLHNLRDNISLVSQDVKLFDTSVFENIRYTKRDATPEEVKRVAAMANIDEFVDELENGYETIIGPNGSLLSGGQKQRLSIARAFLKNSPILLLDEATSALDTISEELIQDALQKLMEGKTTIIIAHRLSTIVNCDKIFVLNNGQLAEEGTHEELIAKNGIYTELCHRQFDKKGKD